MTTLLLLGTAVVALACMWRAWRVSADPVQPMLFLGPMLLYVYVFRPFRILRAMDATTYLAGQEGLQFVLLVNALSVTAFCLGVVSTLRRAEGHPPVSLIVDMGEDTRRSLRRLAIFMGGLGLIAYLYAVGESGGFFHVYARAKGGARAASGYVGEAPSLAFPAILIFFMSQSDRRWRVIDVALLLAFAFPHLAHGILGTRRGPLFLILATLGLGWFLTRRRRMSPVLLIVLVLVMGGAVLFMFSQRQTFYLESEHGVDTGAFESVALGENVTTGDMFYYAGGSILVADTTQRNAWGGKMFLTLLVRPVPKQIWPEKYDEIMALSGAKGSVGGYYTPREWKNTVGWLPEAGSARGFAADFFVEFSWFGLFFCWLYGALWGWMWLRARRSRGLSSILLVLLLALGIYVPTQSVSAVLHRFLFMGIVLWIFWRISIRSAPMPRTADLAVGAG